MTSTGDLRTRIGFLAALVVLAVIAGTSYRSARQALADDRLVNDSYQVLERLQELLVTVVDAETAVRGFVITGDFSFLDAYDRAVRDVPDRLRQVSALTRGSPGQQTRLNSLEPVLQQKIAAMNAQRDARVGQGLAAAQALISGGAGRQMMDAIRKEIAALEVEQQRLLSERLDRNDQSQQLAITVIVVGNLVAVLLLAGAIREIYRENRQRRDAEEQATAERTKLDLILTNLGEGVVAVDLGGRFSHVNPMAGELLGVAPESAAHRNRGGQFAVFEPDRQTPYPEDQLPLARAVRGESVQDAELYVTRPGRPDGAVLRVTGRPLRDRAGAVVGGVAVFSDVSQRRQHEEEITRKNAELAAAYAELDRTRLQQLQLKDELLSHVSHELRTPLTAATQFVEILRDGLGGALNAEQLEYAGIAQRNLRQLGTMIGDLLEATRLESARLTIEPARTNVVPIVEDLCRSLYSPASEKRIALVNHVHDVPDVFADANRVRQVIANLLHNAIKFTESGSITIEAAVVPAGRRAVQVTVTDTGVGMSADVLGRIFTRLYQAGAGGEASRRGLGLGLYICRELVTRQGGQIWAESEPGVGSRFHVTLPVFDEALHGEESSGDGTDHPGHRG